MIQVNDMFVNGKPQLKTLEWWISRSMLDSLFLLISRLIYSLDLFLEKRDKLFLLKNRFFLFLRISGVDGVISIFIK